MLAAVKYIGAGLACSGLIDAVTGIGIIFSLLISITIFGVFILLSGKFGQILDVASKKSAGLIGTGIAIYNQASGSNSNNDKNKNGRRGYGWPGPTAVKMIKRMNQLTKQVMIIKPVTGKILIKTQEQIQHLQNKLRATPISYSFSLPLILSKLDINVTDLDSKFTHLSYGIFTLSLIGLLCFINIIGYMAVYIFLQEKDYETKYPRLKIIINYYKKSSLVFIGIEILLCLTSLILLVFFSLLFVYTGINNR